MRKNKNKPETVDTTSVTETEEIKVPKKKKKKTGLIVFLIILILAVAGAAAYYFMERQKPISTTKNYQEDQVQHPERNSNCHCTYQIH